MRENRTSGSARGVFGNRDSYREMFKKGSIRVIMLTQFSLLGRYNQLMNQRQYDAVSKLTDEQVQDDMGAFFKSILGTLNHIIVGDIVWLQRFCTHLSGRNSLSYIAGLEKLKSLDSILFKDLSRLKKERENIDNIIIQWINFIPEKNINDQISYRNMKGELFKKPLSSLICHLFLHQTHHRGQVTTLLSQCHIDFGDTDLIEIIDDI